MIHLPFSLNKFKVRLACGVHCLNVKNIQNRKINLSMCQVGGFSFERYSYEESQNGFSYLPEHFISQPLKQLTAFSIGTAEHFGSSLMQVFAMASVTEGHSTKCQRKIY